MSPSLWLDPGPDRGWSWVIAVASCWITFTGFGINRASGVLFVAVVETYGISRKEASWPFSLTPAVCSFSAVGAGLLFQVMSARQGLFLGFISATLGVGICYFANSVDWFIAGFGIMFGIGAAVTFPMLTAILNTYFLQKRATANGIYLAGSTFGLFLFPPLIEYLLETFGLRGTMLVLSAIVMNAFVGVILLRPRTAAQFPALAEPAREQFLENGNPKRPSVAVDVSLTEINHQAKAKSYWTLLRDTFTEPIFYFIVYSGMSCITPMLALGMVVTDFGIDKGLPKERAVLLLSAGSIPELMGRLCLGWIADKGYVKYRHLFMGCKVLAGILMIILPSVDGEPALFAIVAVNGLLEGCSVVLLNVLYVEYLGLERLPVAFSWSLFANGFVFLSLPILIGVFRDTGGSYTYLFYLLGLMSVTAAMLWLLEPILVKRRPAVEAD